MMAQGDTLLEVVRSSRGSVVVDGSRFDAADLGSVGRKAAAGLKARGVRRGDSIVAVDNGGGVELLASLLGAWWIGARPTVVTGSADDAEVQSIQRQTGGVLVLQGKFPSAGEKISFPDLLASDGTTADSETCVPGDVALDIASSGSTGRPKCVSFTHSALWHNVRAVAQRLELTEQDVLYSPLPLSIAGVLCMVVLPGLLADSTVHVGRLSSTRIALAHQQVRTVQPTLLYGVPYMYEVLARKQSSGGYENLKWAICSSAPLPAATFDRVQEHLGVPPRNSYCLAEAGTVTLNTCSDPDALRHTVGEPLDGVKVGLESVSGNPEEGRLVIGGTSCGLGYREAGELKAFPRGEVRTGDLGSLQGGLLTLTGRADKVIQVAGQNVDLSYVRQMVSRCPGLGDFEVLVDQHKRLGAVPILLAESKSLTISPREVIAYCRSVLRDVEVPREVRVVDEIPRTATGKVRMIDGGSR
jgi:acyl-CoA synthetase (AMP-forming)/AMP-acid ligase II